MGNRNAPRRGFSVTAAVSPRRINQHHTSLVRNHRQNIGRLAGFPSFQGLVPELHLLAAPEDCSAQMGDPLLLLWCRFAELSGSQDLSRPCVRCQFGSSSTPPLPNFPLGFACSLEVEDLRHVHTLGFPIVQKPHGRPPHAFVCRAHRAISFPSSAVPTRDASRGGVS